MFCDKVVQGAVECQYRLLRMVVARLTLSYRKVCTATVDMLHCTVLYYTVVYFTAINCAVLLLEILDLGPTE
jgi:hypothetical protein